MTEREDQFFNTSNIEYDENTTEAGPFDTCGFTYGMNNHVGNLILGENSFELGDEEYWVLDYAAYSLEEERKNNPLASTSQRILLSDIATSGEVDLEDIKTAAFSLSEKLHSDGNVRLVILPETPEDYSVFLTEPVQITDASDENNVNRLGYSDKIDRRYYISVEGEKKRVRYQEAKMYDILLASLYSEKDKHHNATQSEKIPIRELTARLGSSESSIQVMYYELKKIIEKGLPQGHVSLVLCPDEKSLFLTEPVPNLSLIRKETVKFIGDLSYGLLETGKAFVTISGNTTQIDKQQYQILSILGERFHNEEQISTPITYTELSTLLDSSINNVHNLVYSLRSILKVDPNAQESFLMETNQGVIISDHPLPIIRKSKFNKS